MPINLSKAEARRMGLLPDEPQEKPPARKWGSGPQAPEVIGWKVGKPEILCAVNPELGFTHRWQRKDPHTWIARCGWQRSREGWTPDGKTNGRACPWCFKKEGE
jgi:hypothetical protein